MSSLKSVSNPTARNKYEVEYNVWLQIYKIIGFPPKIKILNLNKLTTSSRLSSIEN